MKICYVNAYFDDADESPNEFLDRVFTLREFAGEQAKLGADVHVLQLFHCDQLLVRDGVTYWFIRPSPVAELAGRIAGALRGSRRSGDYRAATRLIAQLRRIRPEIVHSFGLTLDFNIRLIANAAKSLEIPFVVQYNGGSPPRNRVRSAVQRGNFRRTDRVLFTTGVHAEPWIRNMGLPPARVATEWETSSILRLQPRSDARQITGMCGDPIFLWTGRLHPDKDPLTALRGFELIAGAWPEAQIYLHYLTDELLPDLRQFVSRRPQLAERVHFRGRVQHSQMEAIYNSADFLLQASTREVCGTAVMEAMSCGVIPIVTDIPSFRAMTENGRYGRLFPVHDADGLAGTALEIQRDCIPKLSRQVQARFDHQLSFPAIARRLNALYQDLAFVKRNSAPAGG